MYPITAKEVLADSIKKIEVTAPDIAKRAKAGQFVIIRGSSKGERIPLTIADKNEKNGTVSLIFQEIGKTTLALGRLNAGDSIMDIVGPLGHPTESVKHGTVVAIGGGVGAAEILPVSRMYRECGNDVIGIIGARTRDLVILEREMTGSCGRLFVATDDGSAGRKGFVTDVLKELIEKGDKIDLVYAIGPVPMMRAIANLTKPFGIKTVVSLNPIMID
ncbi:MAG: ferredoxin-NADP reductase, partial [Elusimicrobia bacterium RIFOXYB1_FULL_48_9]